MVASFIVSRTLVATLAMYLLKAKVHAAIPSNNPYLQVITAQTEYLGNERRLYRRALRSSTRRANPRPSARAHDMGPTPLIERAADGALPRRLILSRLSDRGFGDFTPVVDEPAFGGEKATRKTGGDPVCAEVGGVGTEKCG
jgi:hypothetical protein